MIAIIRYEVGDDVAPGERLRDGQVTDMAIWGIDAVYEDESRHSNAVMVMTCEADRRLCLASLNARLGLDLIGRRPANRPPQTTASVECFMTGGKVAEQIGLCGTCQRQSCAFHPVHIGPPGHRSARGAA